MKLHILALVLASNSALASSYDVKKTCNIGSRNVTFEYSVSPYEPDSPAVVTIDGNRYHGIAQGSVAVMLPMFVAYFEFVGDTVTFSNVTSAKKYWLGSGTCTS